MDVFWHEVNYLDKALHHKVLFLSLSVTKMGNGRITLELYKETHYAALVMQAALITPYTVERSCGRILRSHHHDSSREPTQALRG